MSPDKLFSVISDINSWCKWDAGLEFTSSDMPLAPKAQFLLKPKGGPIVKMTVDEVQPYKLVDTAHLFLAKMQTTHEYINIPSGTRICFEIKIYGPLGFLWRRIIGENQIKGAAAQTAAFVAYARELTTRD